MILSYYKNSYSIDGSLLKFIVFCIIVLILITIIAIWSKVKTRQELYETDKKLRDLYKSTNEEISNLNSLNKKLQTEFENKLKDIALKNDAEIKSLNKEFQ